MRRRRRRPSMRTRSSVPRSVSGVSISRFLIGSVLFCLQRLVFRVIYVPKWQSGRLHAGGEIREECMKRRQNHRKKNSERDRIGSDEVSSEHQDRLRSATRWDAHCRSTSMPCQPPQRPIPSRGRLVLGLQSNDHRYCAKVSLPLNLRSTQIIVA